MVLKGGENMANNETTTKFKVDISELKKAMQEAKRSISVANSEFKAASSTMDDWSKSTDGIKAKLKQLDSNLKNQKTILGNLEQQYEAVVEEQGEGSAAADRLKIAINNQKAAIGQTERQISKYEGALTEVGEAEKIAAKTGRDVSEVLGDMGNEAKDAGDGFTVLKGAVATFAGNMLTGLVSGIKDGISSIMGLADETREYRTELAKLDTAFTTAGHSTKAAEQTYKDLYAVLGDEGQSVEAANHLAKLCDTEKELSDWTNIATGVYATFGASLPIEGLAEAANETAKVGQVTGPLADALNWAGVSEDKFNESLEKCSNEQERQQLITETLNGLYDDAAKKYEDTNKSVMDANRANSDYTDTMAALGEKIEPVTTTLKEGFNKLLQKILELVEGVDISVFTGALQEGFAVLTDTVLPAVMDGLGWIIDNKDTVIAGLAGIAGGFVAFKVASLIMSVVNAFKAFKVANEGATVAQWLLNVAMNANPIVLIVTLIATLVAGIIAFIATNEDARAKLKAVWQTIKDFVGKTIKSIAKFFTETIPNALETMVSFFKQLPAKIWTWLTNVITKIITWRISMIMYAKDVALSFINKIIEFVKQLPAKVWTWLVNTVSKVKTWSSNLSAKGKEAALNFINNVVNFVKQLPDKIWTWLTNAAAKVVSWGSSLASKGKAAAQQLLTAVVNKVKEIPSKITSVGADIVTGLWNGIGNKVEWLKGKIRGFVGNVTDWLKKFFKIGSPSRLMRDEVGRWLPEGIAVGISENAKSVLTAMKDLAVSTVGGARSSLGGATSTLGGTSAIKGGVINNFTQVINSPKQLSRLDIYRQSKNLLNYAGGGA